MRLPKEPFMKYPYKFQNEAVEIEFGVEWSSILI